MINMTVQNYCMVNQATNVCDNICLWDGDPNTWTPPAGYLMLVQATTQTKIWLLDTQNKTWYLGDSIGNGQIGYTWDGTYLITNDPQPPAQPEATGTQTL